MKLFVLLVVMFSFGYTEYVIQDGDQKYEIICKHPA